MSACQKGFDPMNQPFHEPPETVAKHHPDNSTTVAVANLVECSRVGVHLGWKNKKPAAVPLVIDMAGPFDVHDCHDVIGWTVATMASLRVSPKHLQRTGTAENRQGPALGTLLVTLTDE